MVRIVMGVTTLDIDDGGRHGVGAVIEKFYVNRCTPCTTQTTTDVITVDALGIVHSTYRQGKKILF